MTVSNITFSASQPAISRIEPTRFGVNLAEEIKGLQPEIQSRPILERLKKQLAQLKTQGKEQAEKFQQRLKSMEAEFNTHPTVQEYMERMRVLEEEVKHNFKPEALKKQYRQLLSDIQGNETVQAFKKNLEELEETVRKTFRSTEKPTQ